MLRAWQLDAFREHCDLRHAKENDRGCLCARKREIDR